MKKIVIKKLLWLALAATVSSALASELPKGSGEFYIDVATTGKKIGVYSYVPKQAKADSPIVFVLAGVNRNASDYRDSWIENAEKNNLIVISPHFSEKDYPGVNGYNLGNILDHQTGKINPKETWSFSVIEDIFYYLKKEKITEQSQYYLFGHSAGCQFAHRLLTFLPEAKVKAAVCTAAGWWTLPDDETNWPYGLAGAPIELKSAKLKAFFSMPILIGVGEKDIDPYHPTFRRSYEAMGQGENRQQRAENYYLTAHQKSVRYKLPFKWQFAIVPTAAHDGKKNSAWAAERFAQFEKDGSFVVDNPLAEKIAAKVKKTEKTTAENSD